MRKELEQKLVERWPTWFNTKGDFRHTGMTLGFRHDDGWFDIIWRLCENLEPLVAVFEQATGCKFEVLQVKEKFGGLRFYANHVNDAIRERIYTAQGESLRTCEICGQPGRLRESRWIKTLCEETYQRRQRNRRKRNWLSLPIRIVHTYHPERPGFHALSRMYTFVVYSGGDVKIIFLDIDGVLINSSSLLTTTDSSFPTAMLTTTERPN